MTDQPTPKTKRQRANKPALQPTLDEETIEKAVEDEVFLTKSEMNCVNLAMEDSIESAASQLGWSLKEVRECLKRPHVRLYAMEVRNELIKRVAQEKGRRWRKKGISPVSVQERLMEIAMMPPNETKGSVDGQVKALQELASHLGLKKDDPLTGKTEEELKAIVAGARGSLTKTPSVN